MNTEPDFEIIIPSEEIGELAVPSVIQKQWDGIDIKERGGLNLKSWEDESNILIRFVAPDNIAVPNNNESLDLLLEEVKVLKLDLFTKLGIETDKNKQILFVLHHEIQHSIQLSERRLHRMNTTSELETLENEADEYAAKKITRETSLN